MDINTVKKGASVNLLNLAKEYLSGAERSFKSGFYRLAIDAGYNAVELAVKALLFNRIDDLPRSHGGIVGKFGELYVKTKEYPPEIGSRLNIILELRNEATYKYQAIIKKEDAKEALKFVKDFIRKVI